MHDEAIPHMEIEVIINLVVKGILAVAVVAMILYTITSMAARSDIGSPLLTIAMFIVVVYVLFFLYDKLRS
jgi:hypothetical protein